MAKEKKPGTVKTMRYEVVEFSSVEARRRWRTIADRCREAVNLIWQQWEVYHVAKGNDVKVQQFAAALRAYRNDETLEKPKLDVSFMPPELSKAIWKKLSTRFPDVHSRVLTLLQNITQRRMNGKDVEGRWNIWAAILLNRQGRPSSTHDQPIPFDSHNSKPLSEVEGKFTNYKLQINLTRLPSDKKNSPSIEDTVQLKARRNGLVIMKRIVSGEYQFCGSSLVYSKSKGKWFALVAYRMPPKESPADLNGTAVLRGRKTSPWGLRMKGYTYWIGGHGHYIAAARKRLLTSRWSRQENYHYAGSANKGHGRERAMEGVNKLSEGWKDFRKDCTHITTVDVVRRCLDAKIGRLVYCQPVEEMRDSRFLSRAGKVEGRNDSTSWDWAQVASQLAYKCKEAGIHFEVRKSGQKKEDEDAGDGRERSKKKGRKKGRKMAPLA